METHLRSIVKSLSWRVLGFFVTTLVAWVLTGHVTVGLGIGLADTAIKLFLYYGHERIWHGITFGKAELTRPGVQGDGI